MKKLEEMNELEKRSLARWIRQKFQSRVNPEILDGLSDEALLQQYCRDHQTKMDHLARKNAEA
jgi:hypothetical protein